MSSSLLEKLVEAFIEFPGIGPRQAKRFAYFLSEADDNFVKELGELMLEIKKEIVQCPSCFRYHAVHNNFQKECSICKNLNRDSSLLMVVEKDVDFENIEKTGVYNGKYFILGGTLSLIGDKDKDTKIRLKPLFEKVKKEKPKEIILGMSATIEGDNTARYTERILEPLLEALKASITRLGRGLSTGTEMEYIDSETFENAMKNRK